MAERKRSIGVPPEVFKRKVEHYEAGGSHPDAIYAMLRANVRAAALRNEAAGLNPAGPPNHVIMHGAPTHSCAFLLQALEEAGWRLVPAPKKP